MEKFHCLVKFVCYNAEALHFSGLDVLPQQKKKPGMKEQYGMIYLMKKECMLLKRGLSSIYCGCSLIANCLVTRLLADETMQHLFLLNWCWKPLSLTKHFQLWVRQSIYISPEVLLKKGYGMDYDWLVFYGTCSFTIRIQKHLKLPEEARLTHEAKNLICRLLYDVYQRLDIGGVEQIKACWLFQREVR